MVAGPEDDNAQCIDCPRPAEPGSSYCKDDAWKASRGIEDDDLVHRFQHHPPRDQEAINAHEEVREAALTFARVLNRLVPDGREKSTAITKVEEVMMWGNAGIARGGGPR